MVRAMADRFDVVAIRVEHKGGVVARVIGAFTRRAMVATTCGECGLIEGLHRGLIRGLEGEVHTRDILAGCLHHQFVGIEEVGAFLYDVGMRPVKSS
jgi:hypothetical protein